MKKHTSSSMVAIGRKGGEEVWAKKKLHLSQVGHVGLDDR